MSSTIPLLHKMIVGTVQFGLDYGVNAATAKTMTQADCDSVLDTAAANGITTLDTAEVYGDSIAKIGNYQRDKTAKFEIISKFHAPDNVYSTLRNSLDTLHIDAYLCILAHRSEHILLPSPAREELARFKSDGLTKYIGVSIYSNDEFARAIDQPLVDVIQFPFNILDNTAQRGDLMRRAKDAGKILHARSAYLQGMFLKPFPLPEKLKPLERYIVQLRGISESNNTSLTGLALEYVFSNSMIDNVVIGHHSASQLLRNIDLVKNFKGGPYLHKIDEIKVAESELLNPRNW